MIPINAITSAIQGSNMSLPSVPGATSKAGSSENFSSMLSHAVQSLSTSQSQASTNIANAMIGQGSLTQAMVSVTQAQMTLDTGIAVRNGVTSAYQTVMDMQM